MRGPIPQPPCPTIVKMGRCTCDGFLKEGQYRSGNWRPSAGHPQTIKGRPAPNTPRNLPPQTRCDWGPPIQSRFQGCDPASSVRVQCDGASPATSTENRALYASTACRGRPALTIHFEAGDPASLLMAGGTPLQKPHGNIQTMHSVTRPRLQQRFSR